MLKTPFGKNINHAWSFLIKNKKYGLLAILLILLGYAFGISYKSIETMIVVGALFALASVSTVYKRYFRAPPIFELMTLTTVIITIKYGFIIGLIYGALAQLVAETLSGAIDAQILIFVPARALLSLWVSIALSLGVNSFFILGMIAVIAYNLMVQPISFFIGDMQLKAKTIYYTIGYTLMNFFLFSILRWPIAFIFGLQA